MSTAVERLIATGQWLYGPTYWVAMLAEDLRVAPDTLRKWINGKREYPAVHYDDRLVDLIDLHRHRGDELRLSFFNPEESVTKLVRG